MSTLRAKQLIKRYEKDTEYQSIWHEEPQRFLTWLHTLSKDLTSQTFKSYQKWLGSYAVDTGYPELGISIRKLSVTPTAKATSKKTGNSTTSRITTNKEHALRHGSKELKLLGGILLSQRSTGPRYKHGIMAFTWLKLTLMTGLRPSEWYGTRLLIKVEDGFGKWYQHVLEVPTAQKGIRKHDTALANGNSYRRLILDSWDNDQMAALNLFMSRLPSDRGVFDKLQESVRQTLIKASGAIDLANPLNLYTGRHFFASEVRRSNKSFSRYELAALLGHKDTLNQKYYGDKSKEKSREFDFALPQPWPAAAREVERIDRSRYALLYGSEEVARLKVSELDAGSA